MTILWWTLTILLMLTGLIGTVLPILPGALLILCGAVLNYFTLHSVGWPTLLALTILALLSQLLDIASGTIGAKWSGSTRWGVIGGITGAVVGLFFGLIGIIVGPLVGVLLGELLGGKNVLPALRTTWGTFLGTAAGIVVKLVIAVIMIVWFTIDALL